MNRIYTLIILLGMSLSSFAWWTNLYNTGSPWKTYYLGDYQSDVFEFGVNQETSPMTVTYGIGTSTDGTSWTWRAAEWSRMDGSNNRVWKSKANEHQFTSSGNWYYSGSFKWTANTYTEYASGGWAENRTSLVAVNYFTVNALSNPTSTSATQNSASQIDLSWTLWNSKNVMIVRKKSSESWTEPTQGNAYSVGNSIGSGIVVYNGSGASLNNTGLASSTGYDYKFYSVNNNYYSAGEVKSATTASEASDYFRSKADGTWSAAGTWESSDNNSNWVNATLVPTSSAGDVVINHAVTISTDETASSITINTNKSLTINAGKSLNVTGNLTMAPDSFFDIFLESFCSVGGSLTNNGNASNLKIHSDATGTGSLITTSTPSATVERYMSKDVYHYISSPVAAQAISPEFINTSGGGTLPADIDFYTWDETQLNSWINIKKADFTLNTAFETTFGVCKGYVYANSSSAVTKNFTGTLNAGNKSVTLTKSPAGQRGWNMVGNPFPSTVAVNTGADASNNLLSINTASLNASREAIYLWNQTTPNTATHTTNEYTAINQASPATYLSPGQAFMVSASANSVSFSIPQTARKHGAATFYKSTETDEVNRFWLTVDGPQGNSNETMLAMIPGTTNGMDAGYDAQKLKGNVNISLYTHLVDGSEGDYAIQSIDQLSGNFVVPVGLDANLTGNYTFKAGRMDNLEAVTVQLEDRSNGTFTTLSNGGEYSINVANAGTLNNRFFLHLKSTVGINDPSKAETSSIYSYGNQLYIQNPGKALLEVFAITGQKLVTSQINSTGLYQTTLNQPTGYYIVRLTSNGSTQVSKIFIQ
jgi:hypothetical protein